MELETENEYKVLRSQMDAYEAWRGNRNGIPIAEIPAEFQQITNAHRSAVELWEFIHNPPKKYLCYINVEKRLATTWTGQKLGVVTLGREYECPAFGRCSKRQSVTVNAVNGKSYYGTYYKSSGDYALIKMHK